jgi:diguanylate cyclase (GGDEF)-like protein
MQETQPALLPTAELVEEVYRLLTAEDLGSAAFDGALAALCERYGDSAYGELIHLLSHLRFEPAEAREHWQRIREHRSRMRGADGGTVDVRVALVSYFVEVNRQLENPKIIEMQLFERTRALASHDELTGLHNYRVFRDSLEQELARSQRSRQPLSLVMIDLDNFKSYNDSFGHEAGNQVLISVAQLLQQSSRKSDLTARYGGEEFAMLLPTTPKAQASLVAERAREAIESFASAAGAGVERVTASFGVATAPADAAEAAELVRRADRALYAAKANGKNQVQLYGQCTRSFGRAELALRGHFRATAPTSVSLTTVNVSEGGLLFTASNPAAVGALIDFELELPESPRAVRGAGRVVHTERGAGDCWRTAVTILEMPESSRAALVEALRRHSSEPPPPASDRSP